MVEGFEGKKWKPISNQDDSGRNLIELSAIKLEERKKLCIPIFFKNIIMIVYNLQNTNVTIPWYYPAPYISLIIMTEYLFLQKFS